jgi:hypothetical protein
MAKITVVMNADINVSRTEERLIAAIVRQQYTISQHERMIFEMRRSVMTADSMITLLVKNAGFDTTADPKRDMDQAVQLEGEIRVHMSEEAISDRLSTFAKATFGDLIHAVIVEEDAPEDPELH